MSNKTLLEALKKEYAEIEADKIKHERALKTGLVGVVGKSIGRIDARRETLTNIVKVIKRLRNENYCVDGRGRFFITEAEQIPTLEELDKLTKEKEND